MQKITKNLTMGALIAALYAVLTILLAPFSFGPIQFRVAEALTVLPYVFPQAVPGLFIGCLVANIYGGLGPIDIFGGSFLTLIAALLTLWLKRYNTPWLAPIPPIIINAFGVSLYLHVLADVPYWLTVLYIGLGQTGACLVLGLPLLYAFLVRRKHF